MLIISHRGYCPPQTQLPTTTSSEKRIEQNTMEAFKQAVDLGVDGIETDVRTSVDGQLVIYHDRLVADGRAVASMNRAELERAVGYSVPVLEDILEQPWELLWNLEIKAVTTIDPVVEAIRQCKSRCRFLVSSFRHDVIQQCAQRLDVDLGLLICHRPIDLPTAILQSWKHHPNVRTLVWDYNFVDPLLIQEASAAGWRNFVFAVHNAQEHQQCLEWGLDAVITDHPQMVISAPPNQQ